MACEKNLVSDDNFRIPASGLTLLRVDGASYLGFDIDSTSSCECSAEEQQRSDVQFLVTGLDAMPIEPHVN